MSVVWAYSFIMPFFCLYVLQISNSTGDCKAKLFHLSKEVISINSMQT